MSNNMQTLRDMIFETMDGLRRGHITVPVANASAALSQVLINSLKVEIDARKAAGDKTLAGFVAIGGQEPAPALTVRGAPVAISDYVQKEKPLSEDEEYYDSLLPEGAVSSGITIHRREV